MASASNGGSGGGGDGDGGGANVHFTRHNQNQFGSQSSSVKKTKKNTSSCDVCRGKGFYMCKLCKGNATIEWSPLYDPVFINPCLCPTCDGHRIQRCLNCLGNGYIQQAKG